MWGGMSVSYWADCSVAHWDQTWVDWWVARWAAASERPKVGLMVDNWDARRATQMAAHLAQLLAER